MQCQGLSGCQERNLNGIFIPAFKGHCLMGQLLSPLLLVSQFVTLAYYLIINPFTKINLKNLLKQTTSLLCAVTMGTASH